MPRQPAKHIQQWELAPGARVWVYLRHSPGDNQTIDSQSVAMQEWCAEMTWIIERMFIDEGIEGSKEEREQFQEMIASSRQQPRLVEGIVVWSFSRFARSQLDSQFYKADLRKRGFVVVSKIDDIPNNEVAPIIEAVVDWKNQRFLEDLSADVKRGHTFIVQKGFLHGGYPPIGFKAEKVNIGSYRTGEIRYGNRVVKDTSVQERVALAWRMKLEANASYSQIHTATNLFHRFKQYGAMFDNMLYAGIYVFRGQRYPLDWESGARFCEGYVTLEEWFQVQSNRESRRLHAVAPRTLASSYLLSSLLWCGICHEQGKNTKLVGGKKTHADHRFYRCDATRYPAPDTCKLSRIACWRIDDAIVSLLKTTILTQDYLASEVARVNDLLNDSGRNTAVQIEHLTLEVVQLQRKVEGYAELIATKGLTPILESGYDVANKLWLNATSRLATLRKQAVFSKAEHISLDEASKYLDEILATLNKDIVQAKRELLARFIHRIYVYPDRLEVFYKFRQEIALLLNPFSQVNRESLALSSSSERPRHCA